MFSNSNFVVFLIIAIVIVLLGISLPVLLRRRRTSSHTHMVQATVIDIRFNATTFGSGWVVVAEWKDPRSKQSFLFTSPPQKMRPKQKIGTHVHVMVASHDNKHYRIDLS